MLSLMETVGKFLSEHFPVFGVFIWAVLVVSYWMDRAVKPALKDDLLHRLYQPKGSHSNDGILGQVPVYYQIVHDLFGLRAITKFISRSCLITALTLTILVATQAIVNEEDFTEITLPFFKQLGTPDGRFILIFAAVFIIDLISIYQTITFLRISRGCRNLFEVTFVAIADFLLSITLFILLFPLFVTFAFFQNRPPQPIYAVISSTPTAQSEQTAADLGGMLVFPPPAKGTRERSKEMKDQIERKWAFRIYAFSLYEGPAAPSLADAIRESSKVGDLTVQTRGTISDVDVVDVLVKFLEASPTVQRIRLVDKSQGFFNASALLQITATPAIEYKYFWRTYSGVLKQINFMDEQFFRIVTLRSTNVSQNMVMSQYNVAQAIPSFYNPKALHHVYCDGKFSTVEKGKAIGSESQFDSCEKAIALSAVGANNVLSVSRYDSSGDTPVPVSPFALSSLTATIVVYYILVARLIFFYAGFLVLKTLTNGHNVLRKHLFLMTSVLLLLFSVPILYVLRGLT